MQWHKLLSVWNKGDMSFLNHEFLLLLAYVIHVHVVLLDFYSNNARPVFWFDPCVVCSRWDQMKCVVARLLSMCFKKQERFAGSPRRSVTSTTAGKSYGGPRLIWSGLDRYCLWTTTLRFLCPQDWPILNFLSTLWIL